jgi:uncharacterized surface protein with fasciclin (FAS1) repeats
MMKSFAIAGLLTVALGSAACSSSTTSPVTPSPLAPTGPVAERPGVPPGQAATQTIAKIAAGDPTFSYLVAALDKAGLVGVFDEQRRYTVFAPTNDAFDAAARAFGYANGPALLAALDVKTLTSILTYHVTRGDRKATSVLAAGQLGMLDGNTALVTVEEGQAKIENANIIQTDIRASNGYIHVIDAVILPPSLRQ